MDPYAILGLARDADAAQIKAAFRHRSKETHPDRGGAAEAFDRVKRAHVVLTDPALRAHFEATGEMIDRTASNPDQPAWTMIAGMIAVIIDDANSDPFANDLIAAMRAHLSELIKGVEKHIAKLGRNIARAEKMRGRFQAKQAQPNMLEKFVEHRLVEYRRMIEGSKAQVAVMNRAIELLADYKFTVDGKHSLITAALYSRQETILGTSWGTTT